MEVPNFTRPPADDHANLNKNAPTEEYSLQQTAQLLRAHEACNDELRAQLDEYRQTHSELRMQLDRLTADTQRIVAAAASDTEAPRRQQQKLADNLRSRLEISEQERETAMELWRLAQAELRAVELELRASQDGSHVQQVRRECVAATSALEHRLMTLAAEHERQRLASAKLASELAKAREQLAEAQEHVRQRDEELAAGLEATKTAGATMQELEAVVRRQQATLARCRSESDALESALASCRAQVPCWERRDAEAHDKLAEALAVTDALLLERDHALADRDMAQKEISRLGAALSELMDSASAKVHAEVDRVKREHADKMAAVSEQLQLAQKREAATAAAVAEEKARLTAEKERMTAELDSMRRPASPVERKLHAAYRELTAAERKHMASRQELHRLRHSNAQLQEELQAATSMQRMCGVDCNVERTTLRSRLADTTHRANELHEHLEHQRELQRKWSAAAQALTANFESRLRYLHSKLRARQRRAKVVQVSQQPSLLSEDQSKHR